MDAEAHVAADPVNPMRIFSEFSAQAPGDAIIAADSGSAANWYARQVRMRGDDARHRCPGTLATMGPAVPYAIGAKFAHPDRPAIAFEGDGAMQMNGLAELLTIARYWPRVERPAAGRRGAAQQRPQPGDLGAAGHGRHARSSSSRRRCRTCRTPTSRRRSGSARITVTDPEQLAGRVGARRWPPTGPFVLDVHCDPDVPPIPPHATLEQMTDMAQGADQGRHRRAGA